MTQRQNVELFLLTHPERDGFLLQVWNDVNLPNNPDTDQLVDDFLIDNYGGTSGWDYYRISDMDLMFAGKLVLASEPSEQIIAMTNAFMRAEAAERELEAQRIRADKAEQEVCRIGEESIDWECRAIAAEQSIDMFDKLFHKTHADLEKAEQESEKWRVEAFRKYPTPEAYELSCEAREKHRQRADLAEQERDKLLNLIDTLDKAVDEDDESEWDYFAILIRKQITAYREGSNTDAKRD